MNDTERFFRNKAAFTRSSQLYDLASVASKAGNTDEAFRLAAKALTVDPTASKVDWLLLTENPNDFVARREIFTLVNLRLADLQRRATAPTLETPQRADPYVFLYWGQGFDQAPPIVQLCMEKAASLVGEEDLIRLDDDTLGDWIKIPDVIEAARSRSYAAYSDYIRFALLSKYGGIWLDSTCYCTEDPRVWYKTLVGDAGFFAFDKKQSGVISSWFLASGPGDYIAELNRLAQILYWSVFDHVTTYFFAHQIFRVLYRLDAIYANKWDARFRYSGNPRLVHRSLKQEVTDADFAKRLSSSFVHKLTYKIPGDQLSSRAGYHRVMALR